MRCNKIEQGRMIIRYFHMYMSSYCTDVYAEYIIRTSAIVLLLRRECVPHDASEGHIVCLCVVCFSLDGLGLMDCMYESVFMDEGITEFKRGGFRYVGGERGGVERDELV